MQRSAIKMKSPSCHLLAGDRVSVEITDKAFDPEARLAAFRKGAIGAGAIVSFSGVVRSDDGVSTLTLSHYPEFTEIQIEQILEKASTRWSLKDTLIIHRVGKMKVGEVIVFVATAADHRRDAFQAADFIMDYLKSEAPFWKQEETSDQMRWIEPRDQDKKDIKRWSQT